MHVLFDIPNLPQTGHLGSSNRSPRPHPPFIAAVVHAEARPPRPGTQLQTPEAANDQPPPSYQRVTWPPTNTRTSSGLEGPSRGPNPALGRRLAITRLVCSTASSTRSSAGSVLNLAQCDTCGMAALEMSSNRDGIILLIDKVRHDYYRAELRCVAMRTDVEFYEINIQRVGDLFRELALAWARLGRRAHVALVRR